MRIVDVLERDADLYPDRAADDFLESCNPVFEEIGIGLEQGDLQ